jgi:hypothetical protein
MMNSHRESKPHLLGLDSLRNSASVLSNALANPDYSRQVGIATGIPTTCAR